VAVDADQLVPLLGHRSDEPEVEAAFVELRTRRRPELDPEDPDALRDWVLVRRQGVELGFIDEAYFNADKEWRRRRNLSSLILYQVYFYTAYKDVAQFTGKLPFGLEWSDDRKEVRRKLHDRKQFLRSYRRDAWELPQFWMTVSYKKANKSVDSVVCQIDLKPWPEDGRLQPNLTVGDWLELLGLPATAMNLRQRIRPLDLAQRIADEEDEGEVNFRYECGLELVFTAARNLKGPYRTRLGRRPPETLVLGAVRFFRSRGLDARQWNGELPFGLAFDDSQRSSQAKIRRKPDEQKDDDLDGYAEWRFREYSLHVMYDNMKNRLLRISIMAPGFD
jgi:hypothetical protein